MVRLSGTPGGLVAAAAGAAGRGVVVVPLSARVLAMLGFRVLFVVVLLGLGTLDPTLSWRASLVAGLAYLAVTGLLSAAVRLPGRGLAVRCFGVSLLVDGVYVQYQREILDEGLATDVCLTALLVAVFLLASFRTGLKLAVWQSVLLLVTLRGQESGLFPAPPGPVGALDGETELLADLVMLWLVVVTTAVAAATNERELRRRRYDAESLARFAAGLHRDTRPQEVAGHVVDFAVAELGAARAVVVRQLGGRLSLVADSGAAGLDGVDGVDGEAARSALLALPRRPDGSVLALRLDPDRDPWLAALLPDARRLVVLGLAGAGSESTSLVVVLGRRNDRAERRVVEAAVQATATASLAWSRAELLMAAEHRAATDGLTGLANRRTLDATLARMFADRERSRTSFALVLVDVDHFKSVNDRLGHQAGDEVLQVVARLLADHAEQAGGTAARYGGEEFAVLVPGTDAVAAAALAQACRLALHQVDTAVPVTASFGVAVVPDHARDADALVRASDAALIAAKNAGRDRVVVAPVRVPAPRRDARTRAASSEG
jgi:diguanylate cyclase (GGDEF)-like protein